MSEPVTNSEIEDVLSSIRRLISENPAKGENGDSEGGSTDKLVLTPAFRVLDGDGTAAADTPEPRGESAPEDTAQDVEQEPGGETPEPEAGLANGPSEASGQDSAESHDDAAGEPTDEPAKESTIEAPEESLQASDKSGEKDDLEQRIAELEAVIGENIEEWEPDDSEYEEDVEAPTILHPAAEASAEWDIVAGQPEYDAEETAEMPDAGVILEAEAVQDADEEADPGDAAGDLADEDILIDEEALRDMVSLLVREQLKGQIGERITRNIRRMVRREIRLALAARDIK